MQNIISLHQNLLSKKITVDSLGKLKESVFKPYANMILSDKINNPDEIAAFIKLCIDYYTYSEDGDILIPDTEYLPIESKYISLGRPRIIYADSIPNYTTWPFIAHTAPGMVGSIDKIYTEEELQKFLFQLSDIDELIIAPKFDGISACIEKEDGKINYAITRADGTKGQNILPVVRSSKNIDIFSQTSNITGNDNMPNGYYKVELAVAQPEYKELIESKNYANRRSATSGIVNSPKNLQYAKFITVIPLVYYDGKKYVEYIAPGQKTIKYTRKTSVVLEEIHKMLSIIRKSDYPFRTDGVVIYPKSANLLVNHNNIMEEAIAFKVNTAEALTTIKYGYMSVGRLGNAIPMLKVEPVEVNETTVNDVSLGSYDKYAAMDLHEHETIIVYSAGDVIPQMRLPEEREFSPNSPYLKIRKACLYCEEKLERIGNEYKCTNQSCMRLITGKITNFLVKLGVENMSDKTVEELYAAKMLHSIEDLFHLNALKIAELPGYSDISANNITNEIDKLSKKNITVSSLFGAIGIRDIGEKKCRKMFQKITIDNALEYSKTKIIDKILNAENIGMKTAEIFTDFVIENRSLIRYLVKNMNIKMDKKYLGNVVFTGFRDDDLVKVFDDIGYELSGNVNGDTVAVVTSENNEKSTKCKEARKKGKSVVNLADVDNLIYDLTHTAKIKNSQKKESLFDDMEEY